MSLELFLDSKIIMSMTKKTHFWPLKEMRRLGLFNDFEADDGKNKNRTKEAFIYEKLQLRSISFH